MTYPLLYHVNRPGSSAKLKLRRPDDDPHQSSCCWKGPTSVKPSQFFHDKKNRKWIWIGVAALIALQIYFVQEMFAALMLFTGVFAVLALVALVLYLIDRAGQLGLQWAGKQAGPAVQLARKGLVAAEELSKKPFHRPRSETAP